MTELFQLRVSGFALGAIYGLVALGFVVIYRASQVFNFAHGELLTLGAVLMVWLNSPPAVIEDALALGGSTVDGLGWPWALSLMVALGVTGLVAAVIEGLCLRPLVGRPVFVPIIVTLFVGAILRMVVMLIFGNDSMPILTPWESMGAFDLGRHDRLQLFGRYCSWWLRVSCFRNFGSLHKAWGSDAGDE